MHPAAQWWHAPLPSFCCQLVVSVLSHQVNAGDRGIVVVGGSVRLGDMAAANRGAFAGSGLEGVMEQVRVRLCVWGGGG